MKVFIDTNILVYAHIIDKNPKCLKALKLLENMPSKACVPVISYQVLNEMANTLINKHKFERKAGLAAVANLMSWEVVSLTPQIFKLAMEIYQKYKTSVWDASIIAAALYANADEIWSEDLPGGQKIEGMKIYNPFN